MKNVVCLPSTLCFYFLLSLAASADYKPTDKIFLNCGGPPYSTDSNGQKWTSDINSKFAPSITSTKTSSAAVQKPSVPQIPYMTARIFQSNFTYTFPVSPGRKFLRLYFYPAPYNNNNVDASSAIFTVTSGPYTLLNNFSAGLHAEALNIDYLAKEFSINVPPSEKALNVTFAPISPFAFVNGIEVISHPDDIYAHDGTKPVVGQLTGYVLGNATALENLYRLNVGGNDISPNNDDGGLFRPWRNDANYIYGAAFGVTESPDPNVTVVYPSGAPSYYAPVDVYVSSRSMGPNASINVNYNLTWIFAVDAGFAYLVRLHLCEVTNVVYKINQRVFTVYLNNQTAEPQADVIAWASTNGVPIHKDYVVAVPSGNSSYAELWVALHPYTASKPQYYDAILNGVEIFKISDTKGNLAGPNPSPAPPVPGQQATSARPGNKKSAEAGVGAGIAAAAAVIGLLVFVLIRRKKKQGKDSNASAGWVPLSTYKNSPSSGSATTGSYASNLCRHFSIAEIRAATNSFDEALLLGVGGFGKVYHGKIDGGGGTTTEVAIKRGSPTSQQGVREFRTEIEMLSKLRHRHLVSLIGYCDEGREMILVYDYMARGTLREHLCGTREPPLPWKQRLEISIGAARGLHYLHTGAKHTIIHRDVKTTNILLDEKWVAKVSDFGLSKTAPSIDQTHVSTVVKGSFGYLDPEYFRRQQLTEKSDVYSFGVVLFEVLCARPPLNPSLPKEQVSLAEWAHRCCEKGMVDQIVDPFLKERIAPECLKKFAETAVKCLSDVGTERPSMGDVLWNLEFALQLQVSAEEEGGKGFGGEGDLYQGLDGNFTDSKSSGMSTSLGGRSLASEDSDGLTPSALFSQIMNPKGR